MRNAFLRFRSPATRLGLAALLIAAAGCDGDAVSPDRASALRSVSGAD